MKNKGFTLIELLGVIVILSLLLFVIVPSVTSSIQKGQDEADKDTQDSIVLAARDWLSDNKATVNNATSYTVTVSTLQSGGYLPKDIKLPSKGCSLNNASVTITATETANNTKYNYKYNAPNDCK